VLWRKLPARVRPGACSRWRCASSATASWKSKVVAREYWSIVATLATKDGGVFEARLVGADGRKITRSTSAGGRGGGFKRDLEIATFRSRRSRRSRPSATPRPPFTTSTLQQEASRKLGLAPAQTMRVRSALRGRRDRRRDGRAHHLYADRRRRHGARGDRRARRVIAQEYGERYCPARRALHDKAKNAQERHEAIRPTDMGRLPGRRQAYLEPEQARLYELIWIRTIASQMESAELERTTVDIAARVGPAHARAARDRAGVKFDGFLTLYQEGRDDEAERGRAAGCRPDGRGDRLERRRIAATQHFTEPPPRYSEASLVKRMEELGIGRPSTYASILAVLREREYVRIDKKRLVPEDKGGSSSPSSRASSALRRVRFHGRSRGAARPHRRTRDRLEAGSARFLARIRGPFGETKDLRTTEVLDALNDLLGPAHLSREGGRLEPARLPHCGTATLPEARQVRRLHRLLELSRMPFTRQLAATNAEGRASGENGGAPGPRVLGNDPDTASP
jgi:DNA topoisomerase-1